METATSVRDYHIAGGLSVLFLTRLVTDPPAPVILKLHALKVTMSESSKEARCLGSREGEQLTVFLIQFLWRYCCQVSCTASICQGTADT